MINFLFLGLNDRDSLNIGLLLGFLYDVQSSLFGLILDGLFHFFDSFLNTSYNHFSFVKLKIDKIFNKLSNFYKNNIFKLFFYKFKF